VRRVGRLPWRWPARLSRLTGAVLAPGATAALARLLERWFSPLRDEAVLDVGCGFAPRWPSRNLLGVDLDPQAARSVSRFAPAVAADSCQLPFNDGYFAAALSVGLFHHLDAAAALRTLTEMQRVVHGDGLIVVLDAVLPASPWRRPAAAAIRTLDRGRRVRPLGGLQRLLDLTGAWTVERMVYSATGLEAAVAVHRTAAVKGA